MQSELPRSGWPRRRAACTTAVSRTGSDTRSAPSADEYGNAVSLTPNASGRSPTRLRRHATLATIALSTHIAAPRERCFDLARSVELHVRSTAATGERAVAGKTAGLLALGDEITWRARHLGVRQSLSGRITAYDRPRHFQDTMLRGAFARLRHDHFFDAAPDGGGTVMRDVLDFAAPLGPLGWLAERLFLTAYLRRFLQARNRELKAVAESDDEWARYIPPVG